MPAALYHTTVPDTPDVVRSVMDGYYYRCPDVAAVDKCVASLWVEFLDVRSNVSPRRREQARLDVDRLLERRLYLEMVT